jgi:uronate dehydrogenase
VFRDKVEARQPAIDRHDPAALYQGGSFVKANPHG